MPVIKLSKGSPFLIASKWCKDLKHIGIEDHTFIVSGTRAIHLVTKCQFMPISSKNALL